MHQGTSASTTTTTSIPTKSMASRQEETHWDEDQRRALAHSHMRTMHELEEGDLDDGPDRSNLTMSSSNDPTTTMRMMMIVPNTTSTSATTTTTTTISSLADDTLNVPTTKNKKRPSSSESSFGMPIRQLWGNSQLMRNNETNTITNVDGTTTLGTDGRALSDFGGAVSRKKQCVTVTSLILAIATIATIALIPSMRNSMESSVSHMAKEGEAFMSHGNKEQQVFSANILSTVMGDAVNLNMNVDGLYSPNYYPIGNTLPVLWMIPESGSDVVLNVLQYCLRLTTASGMGVNDQDHNVSVTVMGFGP